MIDYEPIVFVKDHGIILTPNNIRGYLKQHDADDAEFRNEARNLPDKLERLEAERNKNKVKVYEDFQAERAGVSNKCAAQISDIENRYRNAVQTTRQCFVNALVYPLDGYARSSSLALPNSTAQASATEQLLAGVGKHASANGLIPLDLEVSSRNPQWPPLDQDHVDFGTPRDEMFDLDVGD